MTRLYTVLDSFQIVHASLLRDLPSNTSILGAKISREGGNKGHDNDDTEFFILLMSTHNPLHNSSTNLILQGIVLVIFGRGDWNKA
jgi:hypothetical protein